MDMMHEIVARLHGDQTGRAEICRSTFLARMDGTLSTMLVTESVLKRHSVG